MTKILQNAKKKPRVYAHEVFKLGGYGGGDIFD